MNPPESSRTLADLLSGLPPEPVLLTVHLSLADTDPPVWRRLAVRSDLRLGEVHRVLQLAMGWTDSHLHRFFLGEPWSGEHFVTDVDLADGEGDEGAPREDDARLGQLLRERGDTLGYLYDFGDSWEHALRLEAVDPIVAGEEPPPAACLDGAGACPPEDVGGIPGYQDMAGWVRSGFDPERAPDGADADYQRHLRSWLPEGWNPDEFGVEEVNAQLARLPSADLSAVLAQLPEQLRLLLAGLDLETQLGVTPWLEHEGWQRPGSLDGADAAAMTGPWRTLLAAVGDGLNLTAAGYLPPAVVETVFAGLAESERWFGKGNREDLTPPVATLREAAQRTGLLRKSRGRLLPTARALALRDDPVALLRHIVGRLPLEKDDFGRSAALLQLLAMAGGTDPYAVSPWRLPSEPPVDMVTDPGHLAARVLTRAGWSAPNPDGYRRVSPEHVWRSTHDTRTIVGQLLEPVSDRPVVGELRAEIARTALRERA